MKKSPQHVLKALQRQYLSSFIQRSVPILSPNAPYRHNWHVDCIAWHLEQVAKGKIKRLIITLPPRHLKSHAASIAFPAWLLGHNPSKKIICASYSLELSRIHAKEFERLVASSEFKALFPELKKDRSQSSDHKFALTAGGFRYHTSVDGPITGIGGNIIIIDDIIKAGEALSAERIKANDWFRNSASSRLDQPETDAIVIVMQRVHVDDLVGSVTNGNDDWVQLNIPAIAERDERYQLGDDEFHDRKVGELLHAERYSMEILDRLRREIGGYAFSAQYQQAPIYLGGNIIRLEWLRAYVDAPISEGVVVQSWDTALETGSGNSYSVCTTWLMKRNEYYLCDVVRVRLSHPALLRRMRTEADKHKPSIVLVERTHQGIALVQEARGRGDRRFVAEPVKGDKIERAARATVAMESGRVFLPQQAPFLDDLRTELAAFPNGRHDDSVDSVSLFINWAEARYRRVQARQRRNPVRRSSGRARPPLISRPNPIDEALNPGLYGIKRFRRL